MLTVLGYQAVRKTSSREALALFRLDPSKFDLIITDQTMPEITGTQLAGEILALRPNMPIILCTGYSHDVDADSAAAAGIRAFLEKPLTKSEIARTVRRVLDETR
jgi:CheY-like chemotaxis protein